MELHRNPRNNLKSGSYFGTIPKFLFCTFSDALNPVFQGFSSENRINEGCGCSSRILKKHQNPIETQFAELKSAKLELRKKTIMLELLCEGEVIGSKRIVVTKMPAQVKGTNDLKF
jgi:hypothetical protein